MHRVLFEQWYPQEACTASVVRWVPRTDWAALKVRPVAPREYMKQHTLQLPDDYSISLHLSDTPSLRTWVLPDENRHIE